MNINSRVLKESLLTDIGFNLPKLQSLIILTSDLDFNASEWTADILSGLSRLETISLSVNNVMTKNDIESKLIKNCKLIRKIDIRCEDSYDESENHYEI